MKKINKQEKNEKNSYYEEAYSLFLTGSTIEQIAEKLRISIDIIQEWQSVGLWGKKKECQTEHPKFIGDALKGMVRQKVQKILDSKKEIELSNVEELTKIINLIERLEEHSWDKRAAVVEVMSLFARFARRRVRQQEKLQFLTKLMEKFFEEVEGS